MRRVETRSLRTHSDESCMNFRIESKALRCGSLALEMIYSILKGQ